MEPASPPEPVPESDLDQVRGLILATRLDIVPELITGASVAELIASVQPAHEAWTRIAAALPTPTAAPVDIPAGGNGPMLLDADTLPTAEKIRRGLVARNRKET